MCAIAFGVLPVAMERLDSVVTLLMCGGIAFVGVAADYRDKTEYPIHAISALISGLSSIAWTAMVEPSALLCLLINSLSIVDKKRWLLWLESSCFASVFAGLLS